MLEAAETRGGFPIGTGFDLGRRLTGCEAFLMALLRRRAQGLMLHETIEDLLQGIYAQALSVAHRFEYQGEPQFLSWISRVALQHVANRARYWKVRRREAAGILRLRDRPVLSESTGSRFDPPASGAGASTLAMAREEILIATKILGLLLPRDRRILGLAGAGASTGEIAEALGISHDAAEQARRRALERFGRVARLLGVARPAAR
jgi:RNA polymerase sigma factor (sigma-70 family)